MGTTAKRQTAANGNVKATREDWPELALEPLISDGVESLRVLSPGQKLGVSRSSFCWHFQSRQDLLDQLLACSSYASGFLHVSKQPEAAVAVRHNAELAYFEK